MTGHMPWREINHKADWAEVEGWTVTITARGEGDFDEDLAHALVVELMPEGGAVSSGPGEFGATFSLREPGLDPRQAVTSGIARFREAAERVGLPAWKEVEVSVMTFAEHDRSDSTMPAV